MRNLVLLPAFTVVASAFLAAAPAAAYHASCAGGQLPSSDRCEVRGHEMVGNIGGDGFLACPSSNPSQGEIQYDYMVLFGGSSRYVCTHYHTCAEVQGVNNNVYNAYCN